MSKKIFTIIGIILAVSVLALGGYYFMLQSNTEGGVANIIPSFKNFFPFGGNSITPQQTGTSTPQTPTQTNGTSFAVKLRKIYADPIAGFGIFTVPNIGNIVRHIDAATGHIYETDL